MGDMVGQLPGRFFIILNGNLVDGHSIPVQMLPQYLSKERYIRQTGVAPVRKHNFSHADSRLGDFGKAGGASSAFFGGFKGSRRKLFLDFVAVFAVVPDPDGIQEQNAIVQAQNCCHIILFAEGKDFFHHRIFAVLFCPEVETSGVNEPKEQSIHRKGDQNRFHQHLQLKGDKHNETGNTGENTGGNRNTQHNHAEDICVFFRCDVKPGIADGEENTGNDQKHHQDFRFFVQIQKIKHINLALSFPAAFLPRPRRAGL